MKSNMEEKNMHCYDCKERTGAENTFFSVLFKNK